MDMLYCHRARVCPGDGPDRNVQILRQQRSLTKVNRQFFSQYQYLNGGLPNLFRVLKPRNFFCNLFCGFAYDDLIHT